MNVKNKKIIIFAILFVLFFLTVFNIVGSYPDNYYLNKIKSNIPQSFKVFIKEKIVVHKTYRNLKKNFEEQRKNLDKALNDIDNLPNKVGIIPVSYQETSEFDFLNKRFKLDKYQLFFLTTEKHRGSKGNAYLEYYKDKLFVTAANGIFSYVDLSQFKKYDFRLKVIQSNLKEIIKHNKFYQRSSFGIKDTLILKDRIFISYTKELKKNCFNTSILVAKINYNKLSFKDFYSPNICVKSQNKYGEFNAHHAGGRIVKFRNDKLLFSTGEFRYRDHAQNDQNVLGKIISINLKNKNVEIISSGHRNPQGLYYDSTRNLLFSTEHGPKGGDEINLINLNKIGKKNFGWPLASYGEHYPGVKKIHEKKKNLENFLKTAPLFKSHKKHGFIEPLKYFTPSIGISEIIKLDEEFINERDYTILTTSLNGRSLYYAKIDENLKIFEEELLFIGNKKIKGERMRDILYIKELNKIFLSFEETPLIAIMSIK